MVYYRNVKLRLAIVSYPGCVEDEGRNLAKVTVRNNTALFDKSKMKPTRVSPPAVYNIGITTCGANQCAGTDLQVMKVMNKPWIFCTAGNV